MSSPIRKASRAGLPLKMSLNGVSGSGKTYSALLLAKGILGSLDKVLVIDSEETGDIDQDNPENYEGKKRASDFYAHLGNFSVLPVSPPFTPEKYSAAIGLAVKEGFSLVIIDSGSHVWEGPGGVLDIYQAYGGRFQDWQKANPHHYGFVSSIMKSPIHVLITLRQKNDHVMIQEGAKHKIKKVGLKVQQRDGFEYEMHVAFNIEHETHLATVNKDRTGLFEGRPPFMISEDVGKEIQKWNLGQ